jgi:sugar phosphate isomerase/epimerase
MMELGTCTSVFGHRNILTPARLRQLRSSGITWLELSCLQSLHVNIYDNEQLRSLGRAIKDLGLRVWTVHAPFCPIAMADRPSREAGIRIIERTAALRRWFDFEIMVLHPGTDDPRGDKTHETRWFRQSLAAAVKRTGDIKIAIETMGPGLGGVTAEMRALLADTDPARVGVCLDTGHTHQVTDVAACIRGLGDRIMTLHVHDNNGKSDQHALPFRGTINWRSVSAALADIGYRGVFMYEAGATGKSPRELFKEMRESFRKIVKWI